MKILNGVRGQEEGGEIIPDSLNTYHFLDMVIKEALGSLRSRAGWFQRKGMQEKQTYTERAKGRLGHGLDTSSIILGPL